VFRIGLAVISIHFAAALTAEFITGLFPEPSTRSQSKRVVKRSVKGSSSDLSVFTSRNLFSSKGLSPEFKKKTPPKIAKPKKFTGKCTIGDANASSLPYKLVGTIILREQKRSVVAIMSQSQNKVIPLRVGETFEDKIQIREAARLKVAFTNLQNQSCEFLEIKINAKKLRTGSPTTARKKATSSKGAAGIVSTEPNKYQIDRSILSDAKSNIGEILTQALAIPVEDGEGNVMGFRLTQIVPDSIYERLGLKNEDEICGVNGTPMTQVEQAIEVFSNIDDLANLDLCVRRGGREMNMNYNIN
jgi:general secretion pathway protein C